MGSPSVCTCYIRFYFSEFSPTARSFLLPPIFWYGVRVFTTNNELQQKSRTTVRRGCVEMNQDDETKKKKKKKKKIFPFWYVVEMKILSTITTTAVVCYDTVCNVSATTRRSFIFIIIIEFIPSFIQFLDCSIIENSYSEPHTHTHQHTHTNQHTTYHTRSVFIFS